MNLQEKITITFMSPYHRLRPAADYVSALEEIFHRGMHSNRRTMLLAHYAMPDHIATMRYLSATVGRTRSHSYANRHYGGLAGQVRRELRLRYEGLNLWTLATWPARAVDHVGELSFRMRPELAKAIERLGWTEELPRVPGMQSVFKSALEGQRVLALRAHRKREAGLREAKIADATFRSSDGHLRCEVPGCGFDFEIRYGRVGRGYIQVHHRRPLGERERPEATRLEDLILVCANCHAMIHRDGKSRSPGSLLRRRFKG